MAPLFDKKMAMAVVERDVLDHANSIFAKALDATGAPLTCLVAVFPLPEWRGTWGANVAFSSNVRNPLELADALERMAAELRSPNFKPAGGQ